MINKLKSIDQNGIKKLLQQRIENPEKFENCPLIIWRSNVDDGIQKRILDEVFDEFNKDKPKDTWKYFRVSSPSDTTSLEYDLTEKDTIRNVSFKDPRYGKYEVSLLVVYPIHLKRDYKRNPESLKNYQSLLNNRRWKGIELMAGVPIIALMRHIGDEFETPESYPDAEQYLFTPDFEEWADWALSSGACPKYLIDFIRGDGAQEGITYRWYNFFNNQDAEEKVNRPGCAYPSKWHHLLSKEPSISDESEIDLQNGISFDLKDDLKNYILSKL